MTQEIKRIEFNSCSFTRQPESKRRSDRVYFSGWVWWNGKRKKERLHRYVWMLANGDIPKGSHIHHIDGDTFNNELDNLDCKTHSQHIKDHWVSSSQEFKKYTVDKLLTKALPAAAKWHSSTEGAEWHKKHIKSQITEKNGICIECGNPYTRNCIQTTTKFCCGPCKWKYNARIWRLKNGMKPNKKSANDISS